MELKIILADDHSVVRNGVSIILKEAFKNLEIKNAQNFTELIAILSNFNARIIFLDINISGGNSTAMIDKIRQLNSEVLILMFSAYEETQYALRYIHAGADGFLSKDSSEQGIVDAVKTLLSTGKYVSDALKNRILENFLHEIPINPLQNLSNREVEVAELLARGEGNLEISNILKIQMSTVSTYKNRIFEKLKISNVLDLAEILRIYKN